MKKILLLATALPAIACAQVKLVINGGVLNITNGAALVVNNPNNDAIIQTGGGYIQSEGADNRVVWFVGPGNGSVYIIPFGTSSSYLPLQFNAASGAGAAGQMVFSTYATSSWKNSDNLPAGVTTVNHGSADNSAKTIDRFWRIEPQGYTTKPALSNLKFTYSDADYAAPNTIVESNLIAQRWNSNSKSWSDFIPLSNVNTVNNTVTIPSIAGDQLYSWWTLVDASSPLPVTLVYFTAAVQNKKVLTSWQTSSEQNTNHFEVWRSRDAVRFDSVGSVSAAGNSSSLLNYQLPDLMPYAGTSYYRLKSVDINASFKWSLVVRVSIDDDRSITLYPNPATNNVNISSSLDVLAQKPIAVLYDAMGRRLQSFPLTSVVQQLNTEWLHSGTYRLIISYANQTQTLSFIKK